MSIGISRDQPGEAFSTVLQSQPRAAFSTITIRECQSFEDFEDTTITRAERWEEEREATI